MAPEPQKGPPGHLGVDSNFQEMMMKSKAVHKRSSQNRETRVGQEVKKVSNLGI